MQLVVESAGQVRDVNVNVQVPDATIADLLDALGHRGATGARGIVVNGQFLQGNRTLAQARLHDGDNVRLMADPTSQPSATVYGGPVLAVVAGLDAGHRFSVQPGHDGDRPGCTLPDDAEQLVGLGATLRRRYRSLRQGHRARSPVAQRHLGRR